MTVYILTLVRRVASRQTNGFVARNVSPSYRDVGLPNMETNVVRNAACR